MSHRLLCAHAAFIQDERTALMMAATNGKSECLLALIQAKAGLNLQAKVRWSEAVASVSWYSIDYLGLESKSEKS